MSHSMIFFMTLAELFNLTRGVCTNYCRSAARGASAAAASPLTLEGSRNPEIVNVPASARAVSRTRGLEGEGDSRKPGCVSGK